MPQLVLWHLLHADEQAAAVALAAGPILDGFVQLSPSTEVEIPDAEVATVTKPERLLQGRQKSLLNVVKDARHCFCPFSPAFPVFVLHATPRRGRSEPNNLLHPS